MSFSRNKIIMKDGEVYYIHITPSGEIFKGESVEKLKENYKNGEGYENTKLFNQFTANPPPVTIPHLTDFDVRNARRERYERNERGSDLHFLDERRRASSHKFQGDSKRMTRRSTRPIYHTKANYGNYDDEELDRRKYKRGNEYGIYFDADDTEDKSVSSRKGVSDNKVGVIPSKNYPFNNNYNDKAPPVRRAKRKKLKRLSEEELTETSPEILGVDDATGYMHS